MLPIKVLQSSSPWHLLFLQSFTSGNAGMYKIAFSLAKLLLVLTLYARRYKAFRLIGLHSVCAVLFTLGFAFREYASYHYIYTGTGGTPLIIFILSQVFINVCP